MHLRDQNGRNLGSPIYREQLDFQEDEDGSEQATDFQKTNQIFLLNSKINELNFFIQKMALQHEEEILAEKNFLQQTKKQYQNRQQNLHLQIQKVTTIAQAQRTAKGFLNEQIKSLKSILRQVKSILEIPIDPTSQSFLIQLGKKQKQMKQTQTNYEELQSSVSKLKRQVSQKEKLVINEYQSKLISQNQKFNAKILQLQKQKVQYLSQMSQKSKQIDQNNKKILSLELFQSEYRKTSKKLQQQQMLCAKRQQYLSSLRVKQQLFSITKQKYQEGKLKLDQYIEQMSFKLGLEKKKLEMVELRLLEQKDKNAKLQQLLSTSRQQLRNSEERIASLEQCMQQLQQKANLSNVYKEKQRSSLSNISQLQDKNRQLSSNIQQYAQKNHNLQSQLIKAEETKRIFQKKVKRAQIDIQQKQKEITLLIYKVDHQNQMIKEAKLQFAKLKQQLEQVKKEKTIGYLNNPDSPKNVWNDGHSNSDELIWQKMNQQIVIHYQKILQSQDKIRLQLQQQLQQLNRTICQLKQQLNQNKKQINQLKQQCQLLTIQKKRMLEAMASVSKLHQKRVHQIKQKFKDISEGTEIAKLVSSKSQKNMNILNCYNFCQQTQTGNQLAAQKMLTKELGNTEFKDSKDKSQQQISTENMRKTLVKYSSSDNFADNYRSTQAGFDERNSDLDASIKLYRERNNSMRMQLNI